MKRIVVGVDFADSQRAVIAAAARLAGPLGAEIILVHVAAPDPDFVGYDAGPDVVREQRADEVREEHRRLQALADEMEADGVAASARLIQGPTVETLLEYTREHGADLIVVGSAGKGTLESAILGSVSSGVLRAAPCPVLVVPHPD